MAIQWDEASSESTASLRQWWSITTSLLVAAVFIEAVFAGATLSGVAWAGTAHRVTAALLIAATTIAALAALVTLRRIPHGMKFGLTLLALAVLLVLQAAVGVLSAKGANLLWIHVPLGVALFGFARQVVTAARKLDGK
jgi:hypothetical protein